MLNRLAFSTILPCVQHQNALHLATKRLAFSTKTQCIQHQNALRLAAYCTHLAANRSKIWCKWRFFDINIHLTAFTGYPLFALKQPPARIDFLRLVGLLVNYKPLIMLKFMLKSRQKVELKCSQVKNPNRSLDRLPIIFSLFPSLPAHLSFACRHLACLILSAQPATSFKNKADKILNNTQNLQRL